MSIFERGRRTGIAIVAALLATIPAGHSIEGPTHGSPGDRDDGRPAMITTIEPLPPIGLEIAALGLERQARGGVASLLLRVDPVIAVDDATIDLRLPDGVTLRDGARARRWKTSLRAHEPLGLPITILAGRDGTFTIAAEVTGIDRGRPIRRGIAYSLSIGAERARPLFRNGAHEFRGQPGRGGR